MPGGGRRAGTTNSSVLNQAALTGFVYGMSPVFGAKLQRDLAEVPVDAVLGHAEAGGGLGFGVPFGAPLHDSNLYWRQRSAWLRWLRVGLLFWCALFRHFCPRWSLCYSSAPGLRALTGPRRILAILGLK